MRAFLDRDKSAGTRSAYAHALAAFFSAAGVRTRAAMLALRPRQARAAFDRLRSAYEPSTLGVFKSALGGLYNELLLDELVQTNPFPSIKIRHRYAPAMWNVLAPTEIDAIIAAPTGPHAVRDIAVLTCLIEQGWRVHELSAMRVADLTVEADKTWSVRFVGKGGRSARDTLTAATVAALQRWGGLARPKTHALIPRTIREGVQEGQPLSRQAINAIVRRWASTIGSRCTAHGLRATFISRMLRQTQNLEEVSRRARHASVLTTVGYSRWL